ncbi:MAG: bifunctional heptose 7-phosphate kinase/heptose 1-phosphate adenyltransferase [Candidatus Hodarchaeales archaeon]|jgi:D-beta-D-heptose 7-phosphate kinase/D-beta-D-heptose 1-phosphate adenosyltransferase
MEDNEEFLKILSTYKNKRLLVIGDIIVDRYIRGTVDKIAPDAPVPLVDQYSAEEYLGGALNVARCVHALRGKVCLCSVIGNDDEGRFVRETCEKDWEMDIEGIFTIDGVHTTLNTRVTGNNQHITRINRNIELSNNEDLIKEVKVFLSGHRHGYDAIIIADYDKGFITPAIVDFVVETFGSDIPIIVRPMRKHFNYYNDVSAIILHRKTAEKLLQITMLNETSIRNSGLRILRMLNPEAVLITWIQEGFHLFPRGGKVVFIPSKSTKIPNLLGYRDVTLGDTITSFFALGFSSSIGMEINTKLTLRAAEYYISRTDTSPITYEEFLECLKT